jgi:hypothetical protein
VGKEMDSAQKTTDTARRKTRRGKGTMSLKRIGQNVLLLLIGITTMLALIEIGLRIWYPPPNLVKKHVIPDPVLGWRLEPNASVVRKRPEYRVEVNVNSHGWRDVEHSYDKPEGIYRIVLLGDSFMEAYQVELEDSMARQLERLAHQSGYQEVEVINLGVSGYGTYQEYLAFTEEGIKYDPDLVLLAFYADNDVHNNSYAISHAFWGDNDPHFFSRPYLVAKNGGWQEIRPDYERAYAETYNNPIWQETALYGVYRAYVIERSLDNLAETGGARGAYLCHPTREYEEAWEVTGESLSNLNRAVIQSGARLVVFTVPANFEVEPPQQTQVVPNRAENSDQLCIEEDIANERVKQMLDDLQIPIIDLMQPFREADGPLFYDLDPHWNVEGHRLAAEVVFETLVSWELLP